MSIRRSLTVALLLLAARAAPADDSPATLEDIYGDTGNTFQGALGFVNLQGKTTVAKAGFGQAIDDMVIEWREFTLEPDATDCAAGSCATVMLDTDREFIGDGVFTFRVLEQSPYGFACSAGSTAGHVCFPADPSHPLGSTCSGGSCIAATNDCDSDGIFLEPGDDNDCDNDGTPDVVALMKSEAEPLGEPVVANRTSTGVYEGSIAATTLGDSPPPPARSGVLFVAKLGATNPTVTVQYFDNNDGVGDICENTIVQVTQGAVGDGTVIFLDQTCQVVVSGFTFSDNGDGDDYLDTRETGTLEVLLENKCGFPLTNCVMRVATGSPEIACIQNPSVPIPFLDCTGLPPCLPSNTPPQPSPPINVTAGTGLWRCNDPAATPCESTADCPATFACVQDVFDPPSAQFTVTMRCDQVDGIDVPQSFTVTLDLDVNYNSADLTTWSEGFETSNGGDLSDGGTKFMAENNDIGIPGNTLNEGLQNGDGWRCQYSDPDWEPSGSSGGPEETNCFPAHTLAHAAKVYWRIDGNGIPENLVDDGRARSGVRSMYYGVYDQMATQSGLPIFTIAEGTVEGARTIAPINLAINPPPVLSWWQQASLIDERRMNVPAGFSGERGVVQLQLAAGNGNPLGDWIKLVPTKNAYDQQAYPNFFNCQFDPVDDGNDEDDFFDPTDPNRLYGPSSTCFGTAPGYVTDFTYGCIGDTDQTFNTDNVCNGEPGSVVASDRPSWPPGTLDVTGTWLQSRVDLSEYKGRRVRLRYLVAGTKSRAENYELTFKFNPDERDDGWWIDEVTVSNTLLNPVVFSADPDPNTGLPACGAACTSVAAHVTVASAPAACDDGGNGSAEGLPCISDVTCAAVTAGSECRLPVNPVTVTQQAPGQPLELNALGSDQPSVAQSCHDGGLQFRFKRDAAIIRDFSENPVLLDAPLADAVYEVTARCSSLPSCNHARTIDVDVTCPSTGVLQRFPSITAIEDTVFDWEPLIPATSRNPEIPERWQVRYGPLANLPSFTTGATLDGNNSGSSYDTNGEPPLPAGGRYYVFARDDDPSPTGRVANCNELPFLWGSGGAGERSDDGVSGSRDDNGTLPPP